MGEADSAIRSDIADNQNNDRPVSAGDCRVPFYPLSSRLLTAGDDYRRSARPLVFFLDGEMNFWPDTDGASQERDDVTKLIY